MDKLQHSESDTNDIHCSVSLLTQTRFTDSQYESSAATSPTPRKRLHDNIPESEDAFVGGSDPERTPLKKQNCIPSIFAAIKLNDLQHVTDESPTILNVLALVVGIGVLREVPTKHDSVDLREILVSTPTQSNVSVTLFGYSAKDLGQTNSPIAVGNVVLLRKFAFHLNKFQSLRVTGKTVSGSKPVRIMSKDQLKSVILPVSESRDIRVSPQLRSSILKAVPEFPLEKCEFGKFLNWVWSCCRLLLATDNRSNGEVSSKPDKTQHYPARESPLSLLCNVKKYKHPVTVIVKVIKVETQHSSSRTYIVLWLDDGTTTQGSCLLRIPVRVGETVEQLLLQDAMRFQYKIVLVTFASQYKTIVKPVPDKLELQIVHLSQISLLDDVDPRAKLVTETIRTRDGDVNPDMKAEQIRSFESIHKVVQHATSIGEGVLFQVSGYIRNVSLRNGTPNAKLPWVKLVCCMCFTPASITSSSSNTLETIVKCSNQGCMKHSYSLSEVTSSLPKQIQNRQLLQHAHSETELLLAMLLERRKQHCFTIPGFEWQYNDVCLELVDQLTIPGTSINCIVIGHIAKGELFSNIPAEVFGCLGMGDVYQNLSTKLFQNIVEAITSTENSKFSFRIKYQSTTSKYFLKAMDAIPC